MNKYFRFLVIIFFVSLYSSVTGQNVNQPVNNEEWVKPYRPFRIVGNLYYVGTYDLGCYLIVTSKGNILINTGLERSLSQIKKNIEELGFKYKDIKILLTNQAHYDHVGAMAAVKKETGAQFWADFADAEVLKDGGVSDYEMNYLGLSFKPVVPDKLLKDSSTIHLGDTKILLLHHPGHTKGSCSYLLDVKDDKKSYKVLIANIPTIITEKNFRDIKAYPNIQKDYEYTFEAMKKLRFDIWVAAHASQFKLHNKRKDGDAYNPKVFIDKSGYDEAINKNEKEFNEKVEKEKNL